MWLRDAQILDELYSFKTNITTLDSSHALVYFKHFASITFKLCLDSNCKLKFALPNINFLFPKHFFFQNNKLLVLIQIQFCKLFGFQTCTYYSLKEIQIYIWVLIMKWWQRSVVCNNSSLKMACLWNHHANNWG